jgi:hypothetical protein
MATRCATPRHAGQLRSTSIFARFAGRLRTIQAKCNLEPSYRVDRAEPLFEDVAATPSARVRHWYTPRDLATCLEQSRPEINTTSTGQRQVLVADNIGQPRQDNIADRDSSVFHNQVDVPWSAMDVEPLDGTDQEDEGLLAISQSLLDPDFTSMDRIVSFEDMMVENMSEAWDFS